MARYHAYRLAQSGRPTYVLDIQSDNLSGLSTRAVVPLIVLPQSAPAIRDFHPVFEIDGVAYIMFTEAITSLPARNLNQFVCSFDDRHADIMRALDILLTGY